MIRTSRLAFKMEPSRHHSNEASEAETGVALYTCHAGRMR